MLACYMKMFQKLWGQMASSSTPPPQPDPSLLCVLSPEPSLSSPRIADQESWLKDNQGRLDGSLHQQGRHEEEALLEARLKVYHHVQG